jgi:hypothetical protein
VPIEDPLSNVGLFPSFDKDANPNIDCVVLYRVTNLVKILTASVLKRVPDSLNKKFKELPFGGIDSESIEVCDSTLKPLKSCYTKFPRVFGSYKDPSPMQILESQSLGHQVMILHLLNVIMVVNIAKQSYKHNYDYYLAHCPHKQVKINSVKNYPKGSRFITYGCNKGFERVCNCTFFPKPINLVSECVKLYPHIEIRFKKTGIIVDSSWPLVKYGNISPSSVRELFHYYFGTRTYFYKKVQPKKEKDLMKSGYQIIHKPVYTEKVYQDVLDGTLSDLDELETVCYSPAPSSTITFNYLDTDPRIERFEFSSDNDKDYG